MTLLLIIYLIGVVLAAGRFMAANYNSPNPKTGLLPIVVSSILSWPVFFASSILYLLSEDEHFLLYWMPGKDKRSR